MLGRDMYEVHIQHLIGAYQRIVVDLMGGPVVYEDVGEDALQLSSSSRIMMAPGACIMSRLQFKT